MKCMYPASLRRWPDIVRVAFVTGWLALLGACSSTTTLPDASVVRIARESLSDFSLVGRFSLRQEGKSYSGRLSWQHAGDNNDLVLSSPFGQGMAEVVTRAEGARLTTGDGKVYSAADAETLTDEVLGYPLPLSQLTDWVRARVVEDAVTVLDTYSRPKQSRQAGWRIEYAYADDDPAGLPNLIRVERDGGFELRLRIDEWSRQVNDTFEKGNE